MKFRLLDLFCGAGGASMGYYRAGFEAEGVDIKPQPHYPFKFYQADALKFPLEGYDAYHASPPCQLFSTAYSMNIPQAKGKAINLIPQTRARLLETNKLSVIENIPRAPLRKDLLLCGTMFNLGVFRHRIFEIEGLEVWQIPHEKHNGKIGDGHYYCITQNGWDYVHKQEYDLEKWKVAMGIDWHINKRMLAEAIPPAYTEYIGKCLLVALKRNS